MAVRVHVSTHVGHHYYAVRAILGFLYSLNRAANVHGQDLALECAAKRLSIGIALSERLVGGPWYLKFCGRSPRSSYDIAVGFVQTMEYGGFIGAQSQFRRCYMGRM